MTECPAGEIADREYFRAFIDRAGERRIPLSGTLDLTYRCNFRCAHCYAGPAAAATAASEMTTERALSLIDEATDSGCLFFLISGGEPLLRPDFPAIYAHARRRGLLVSVFTNGSLVGDRMAALFHDYPPQSVEISLYGATPETYARVTGHADGYERSRRGIARLLDRGVRVQLKTVLMTLNRDDFSAMAEEARSMGLKFRMDAAVFPRFDGDRGPLELRVSAEEAVGDEFSDPERAGKWRRFYEKTRAIPASDDLYTCGAGVRSFHIDPYGFLRPCLMTREPAYDLTTGCFRDGWERVMPRIRTRKVREDFACARCGNRALCGFCPAFFESETGDAMRPSAYLCSLGKHRASRVADRVDGGDRDESYGRAEEAAEAAVR